MDLVCLLYVVLVEPAAQDREHYAGSKFTVAEFSAVTNTVTWEERFLDHTGENTGDAVRAGLGQGGRGLESLPDRQGPAAAHEGRRAERAELRSNQQEEHTSMNDEAALGTTIKPYPFTSSDLKTWLLCPCSAGCIPLCRCVEPT